MTYEWTKSGSVRPRLDLGRAISKNKNKRIVSIDVRNDRPSNERNAKLGFKRQRGCDIHLISAGSVNLSVNMTRGAGQGYGTTNLRPTSHVCYYRKTPETGFEPHDAFQKTVSRLHGNWLLHLAGTLKNSKVIPSHGRTGRWGDWENSRKAA